MADIDEIRTAGNWSDVFVLIDAPTTVYTARATGAVDESDWTIDFDGGAGTLGNCLADMTLLIGSAAGGCDIGIARMRKAPIAGTFYIGADPSLVVEDNDYLTVVDDFEIFSKHDFGVLLDVDQAYSDQFSSFVPIPWFNGREQVIEAGETAVFDASDCWVPGANISAYAWTFTGATSYTDETTATPTATYETSGRFRVALAVSADNGKNFTGYGYVFVIGTNLAAEADAIVDPPECDAGAGALCRVTMLDRPTIRDGARAIVWSRDHFDGEAQAFGPVAGRENIWISGRIVGESILRQPGIETVEFELAGPIGVMSEIAAQVCGLVDKTFPTDDGTTLPAWALMDDLTVEKAIHYLIVQRSTIARCCDIQVEDYNYACPQLTGEGDSLYQQLSGFAGHAAMQVCADRVGRVFVERDAQLYPLADRAADIPVMVALAEGDWQDELTIVRRQRGEAAICEAEGELFSNGELTRLGGRSPGDQPSRHGRSESLRELYIPNQATVLELAGLLAGSLNQEIERISVRMAYANRLMDAAPKQYVTIPVDGDTITCIVRNVSFRPVDGTGFWPTELDLEPVGGQWPAVAIEYPGEEEPPVEPPVEPPEDPPAPPDEPPEPPEPSDADAVGVTATDVRICEDLDEASPTWTTELA